MNQIFSSGNTYSWRKVTTTVHNIIVGKLWVDNHGEMTIENHKTGDKCHLKYLPYSYFSRDSQRKVSFLWAKIPKFALFFSIRSLFRLLALLPIREAPFDILFKELGTNIWNSRRSSAKRVTVEINPF